MNISTNNKWKTKMYMFWILDAFMTTRYNTFRWKSIFHTKIKIDFSRFRFLIDLKTKSYRTEIVVGVSQGFKNLQPQPHSEGTMAFSFPFSFSNSSILSSSCSVCSKLNPLLFSIPRRRCLSLSCPQSIRLRLSIRFATGKHWSYLPLWMLIPSKCKW